MKERLSFKNLLLVLIVFSFSLKKAICQQNKDRPNVLLILIDDLNSWTGFLGGHPNAYTPNLDGIAESGLVFNRAYTAAPICNPSRVALLSGVAPYNSGVYQNRDSWSRSENLKNVAHLPQHFKENGYYTMTVGKVFHSKPDNLETSYDERGGRLGGQNWDLVSPAFTYPFEGIAGMHNIGVRWGPIDEPEASKFSDPKIAAWAIERLQKDYEKPFFLSVGFHRPHTPLTAPAQFFERFNNEDITLPVINENDLDDIPLVGKQIALTGWQEMQNGHYYQITRSGVFKEFVTGYLAATSFVDAQVGKVLKTLENSEYRDNTIVIIASDHGWNLGEKTHFKKWGLWENTTHLPMIILTPGIQNSGKKNNSCVSLIDIYPTLVDLCNLPLPKHQLDGRSLKGLLQNPDSVWKFPAITTYGKNNHSIRLENWRYIEYYDNSKELYNHRSDPGEWHNLAKIKRFFPIVEKLRDWLPKTNVAAVRTDHELPIMLTPLDNNKQFMMQSSRFIGKPLHIQASIGPSISDGIIVCQGSQFAGYALYVNDGKLCFSVMDVPQPLQWDNLHPYRMMVISRKKLKDEKQDLDVKMNADGDVELYANGILIGSGKAKTLSIHPAGEILLGKAHEKIIPIGDYTPPFIYQGDIERVIINNRIE